MIDKSGVTRVTGLRKTRLELFGDVKAVAVGLNKVNEKINDTLENSKPGHGEIGRIIEDVVNERELKKLGTIIDNPNRHLNTTEGNQSTNNKHEERRRKNVTVHTQMEIPGKSLAEKLARFDSPSNGKKIFKTFKRPNTQAKDQGAPLEVVETVEEKKRRFREQKNTMSAKESASNNNNNNNNNNKYKTNSNNNINNNNNNKNNNNGALTSFPPSIAKTVKRASKLFLRASSISDVLNLTDEERLQREWKEKNGKERIPNKMNKMLVKAIKKWRSYQVEPQQMNLGQFNKLKEQYKTPPRPTKKATPGRPVLAGRSQIVSLIEGATSTKASTKRKYPLKKDEKSVNNEKGSAKHKADTAPSSTQVVSLQPPAPTPKAQPSTIIKVAATPIPALPAPITRDTLLYPSENPISKRLEKPTPPEPTPPPTTPPKYTAMPTPPTAQYTAMWDVNLVLPYLSDAPVETFTDLSNKLVTLLMILSGNRVNLVSQFKLSQMNITDNDCTFSFDSVEKPLQFKAYPHEPLLCPVTNLKKFVELRQPLTGDDHLFVTTRAPYNPATADTLARWVKKTLQMAGIDIGKFQARSCSLATIVKFASWSNVNAFKKFYGKDIQEVYDLHVPEAIPG